MAGNQSPQRPDPGAGLGWTALSYLMAGMAFWGFVGWLVDRWLTTHGIAIGIGIIVGAAAGVYLVMRRLGA
jgi:ATP synthase protein I